MSSSKRPAFGFFLCPDLYLLKQAAASWQQKFPAPQGTWKRAVFFGDEPPPADFWPAFSLVQLLPTYQIIEVLHAEKWKQEIWQKLLKVLLTTVDTSWPLLLLNVPFAAGKPKIPAYITKSKAYTIAQKRGWIWSHPGLTEETVWQFVQSEAKSKYPSIPQSVLQAIATTMPLDGTALANELSKQGLYYASVKDTACATSSLGTSRTQEINSFTVINLMEQGNLTKILELFADGKDAEQHFFVLSTMLEREFRILWQLKTGIQVTMPLTVLRQKQRLLAKVSYDLLAWCMSLLVEYEWQVKQGELEIQRAIEQILILLTTRFARLA